MATIKLNDSQLHELERFEGQGKPFTTALEGKYIRAMQRSDIELLKRIYREATGVEYRLHGTCGQCVFKFVLLMAESYRDAMAQRERLEEELLLAEALEAERKAKRNARDRQRRAEAKARKESENGNA